MLKYKNALVGVTSQAVRTTAFELLRRSGMFPSRPSITKLAEWERPSTSICQNTFPLNQRHKTDEGMLRRQRKTFFRQLTWLV